MTAWPVIPLYEVGEIVTYRDRQGRVQTGTVQAIEASWRYRPGVEPLVVYTISHPSYRNNRIYTTAKDIFGLSNSEPRP